MRNLTLCCFAIVLLVLSGCNSGSKPIQVTITSPTGAQALDLGQTFNITVTVANDKLNKGATFTLSGVGTLSNQSSTGATYTAPSTGSGGTATITIASASDATKTVTITVTVAAPPSISTASLSAATEGAAYSGTVAVSGGAGALTYSISVGSLPAGLSINSSTGAITGTPTGPNGTVNFTVQVKDSSTVSPQTTTKALSITVNLPTPPSITTTSPLPAGQVGTSYSQTIAVSGGLSPFTFSVSSGTLPAGLSLNSSTGAITGSPTAYGASNFTIKVVDSSNPTQSASQAFALTIAPAPVNITTTSLPNVVVNTAYSSTLTATGGATPIAWSVSTGSLPAGLNLNASTGAITGTPTTAGTSNFTVKATDSSTPALTATKALSIVVIPVLSVTTTSLSNGVANTSYSATLASTGGFGAVTWSVSVGSLPAGLNLNASTGAITGTPTTAGTSNFTVQAADAGSPQQKVSKALGITVNPQLVITSASLPTGSVTSTYSASLSSTGGVPAIAWSISVGALPAGLTLNAATGAITGTPTGPSGTAIFTAQAVDSGTPQQTVTKQLNITITPVLSITTSSPLSSGSVGTAYSLTLQSNGGGIVPLAWTVTSGSLPPGLTLGAATGTIGGTPTSATGSPFSFTVQAADSGTPQQIASKALTISISTAPLSVATTSLPNGVNGQAYSATLQSAGGTPPVTWSISSGSLPSWATLNASTGAITGTPNATGTTTFTVKATDSTVPTAQTATKQISIAVVSALSVTTASLPTGTVGSAYSATVSATGGTTPYAWSWSPQSGSSLPPGLNINSSTGAITGTPGGSGGTYNVTVTATDSGSPQQTASANFSIAITVATLAVTTTSSSLPAGTVNSAYASTQLNATGGISPYTWAVTVGSLPLGLNLSASGQITGTPTTAGTSNFTAQVTDSAAPTANTATASLSITVNAVSACATLGSESMLSGQYAFVLKGFDDGTGTGETAPEPALVGGVLTFNGSGKITTGALDLNLNSGVQTNLSVTSGSYAVGSDQRGCMVITTSAGTQNYRFSLGNITSGVASTGHVVDFDPNGPFVVGTMRKQTTSAFGTGSGQVTGNYVFGVSSAQNTASCIDSLCGGKFGAVGVFDFSAGNITGGELDFNNSGELDANSANTTWPASPVSVSSGGAYTVSSTTGRGTVTFTPGATSALGGILYVVSSTELLCLSSDTQTNNNIWAGELLQQSGSLSGSPLSGTYVGYDSGLGGSNSGRTDIVVLGPFTSGNSSLNYTQLRNDGGVFTSSTTSGGTYSSSSSGRVTIPGGGGNHSPVLYLVSSSAAFSLNSNPGVDSGFFQSQTGTSSPSGTYAFGNLDPQVANAGQNTGVAVFASPNLNITQDDNGSGTLTIGETQSLTYSVDSTGLGHIPSGCTISASSTTCQTVFSIISPSKAVVMDTTSGSPRLTLADK